MPYWDELRWHEPDEVDSVEDVEIPATAHHMQAKAEVDMLVEEGRLSHDEGAQALRVWKAENKGNMDPELGAIDLLEKNDVITEDEADDLRSRVAQPA